MISINTLEGERIEGEKAVHDEVVTDFSQVLGQSQGVRNGVLPIRRRLTDEQGASMIRVVSDAEDREAMFSINLSKAPGPDGFNAAFFKCNWETVC